jgi:hypothetical protein
MLNSSKSILNLIRLYFSKNLTKRQKKYDFFNCKIPSRYSLSTVAGTSKPNLNVGTIGIKNFDDFFINIYVSFYLLRTH